MTELTLEIDEHPADEDLRVVLDGVRKFNREQTGHDLPRAVACFLRDEQGKILGGVRGGLWGSSAHIDALWVDEHHRGEQYGSKLMRAIEDYAASHGYPIVFLETASFQALPFYRGLDYQVFGELKGVSPGHTLYFLCKDLSHKENDA